ncbi:hypothetical protein ABTJ92_22520, partial [Acinetobacter baumannii]
AGLELYNASYNYVQKGVGIPAALASLAPGGKQKNDYASVQAQIPSAESHVVATINKDRASNGVGPVQQDSGLTELARAH